MRTPFSSLRLQWVFRVQTLFEDKRLPDCTRRSAHRLGSERVIRPASFLALFSVPPLPASVRRPRFLCAARTESGLPKPCPAQRFEVFVPAAVLQISCQFAGETAGEIPEKSVQNPVPRNDMTPHPDTNPCALPLFTVMDGGRVSADQSLCSYQIPRPRGVFSCKKMPRYRK